MDKAAGRIAVLNQHFDAEVSILSSVGILPCCSIVLPSANVPLCSADVGARSSIPPGPQLVQFDVRFVYGMQVVAEAVGGLQVRCQRSGAYFTRDEA
jgi:hypothetical protein